MIDKRTVCDFCMSDERDCIMCRVGNPCLGCEDYDQINHTCKSNGGCIPEFAPRTERETNGKNLSE